MENDLTTQKWVYERLQRNRECILTANKSLGDRATVIAGAGTALATFFGSGKLWNAAALPFSLLVSAVLVSIVVFVAASLVWSPRKSSLPGSLDIQDLWEGQVDQPEDVAIANLIADEIQAIKDEQLANDSRCTAFYVLLISVWAQVTLVCIAVWLSANPSS